MAILHGIDGKRFEPLGDRVIGFLAALVGSTIVTALFFFSTALRLRRMDVPEHRYARVISKLWSGFYSQSYAWRVPVEINFLVLVTRSCSIKIPSTQSEKA